MHSQVSANHRTRGGTDVVQDETCAELSATRIFVAFGAGRTQGRTVVEEDNLAALELEHHPLPLRRVNLTLLLNPKPHFNTRIVIRPL